MTLMIDENVETPMVPDDFKDNAAEMTITQLMEHYGRSRRSIERFFNITGTEKKSAIAPPPSDFVKYARTETNSQLAFRYCVGDKVVRRWRKETGVNRSMVGVSSEGRAIRVAALPKRKIPEIGLGQAAQCAQFLRRRFSPVYHRIILGKQHEGTYTVGRDIMTTEKMISLAVEKGYLDITDF